MTTIRNHFLLSAYIVCRVAVFVNATLPEQRRITDVVVRHANLADSNKKEKLKALNSINESAQLTSSDLKEIGSVIDSYSSSLDAQTSANELFEIISATGLAIMSPENHSDEYWKQREKLFKSHEVLVSKARKLLAGQGDSLIDQLLVKRTQGFVTTNYTSNAIEILAEIGSPKAKRTLLKIIDLQSEGWGDIESKRALYCYLTIVDSNDAQQLLASRDDRILEETVRCFPELVKEPTVFDRVARYLRSNDLHERLWAIRACEHLDPSEKVSQRIDTIAKSLHTVDEMPNSSDRYAPTSLGTRSDFLYGELCRVLSSLNDADNYLVKITNDMEGLAKKWIIVTRAYRGDASVKNEVISILKDQSVLERTSLRSVAVSALGIIGTPEDIAFLTEIEKKDPLNYLNRGGSLLERINDSPINNAGERAVLVYEEIINYDPWEKHENHKSYFIREQAARAIKQIKGKLKVSGTF